METRTEIVELTIQLRDGDQKNYSADELLSSAHYTLSGKPGLGAVGILRCEAVLKTKRFTVVGYNPDNGERFAHHIVAKDAAEAEHKAVDQFGGPEVMEIAGVFEGFLKAAA